MAETAHETTLHLKVWHTALARLFGIASRRYAESDRANRSLHRRFNPLPHTTRLRYNTSMETRQQRIIREIVDGPGESADTSLQRQAERHMDEDYVPRTLTPHEWEQWYDEHGVPAGHRRDGRPPRQAQSSRWRRLLARLIPALRR